MTWSWRQVECEVTLVWGPRWLLSLPIRKHGTRNLWKLIALSRIFCLLSRQNRNQIDGNKITHLIQTALNLTFSIAQSYVSNNCYLLKLAKRFSNNLLDKLCQRLTRPESMLLKVFSIYFRAVWPWSKPVHISKRLHWAFAGHLQC